MKANLKRIQIDLDAEDVSKLKALAASRGHLLKPFIEYLLNVQIGALPEVQPVKAQPLPLREPSAEDTAREYFEKTNSIQWKKQPQKHIAETLIREYPEKRAAKRESKAVTFLKWLKIL